MHVDGKSHGRRLSAMCTAKSAPAAPAVAALWAAHGRRNARIGMGLVKLVHRSHARGHACLKEQIARVARAAIGQGRRAENLDLFAVVPTICPLVTVCAPVQPHGRRLGGWMHRLLYMLAALAADRHKLRASRRPSRKEANRRRHPATLFLYVRCASCEPWLT